MLLDDLPVTGPERSGEILLKKFRIFLKQMLVQFFPLANNEQRDNRKNYCFRS